MDELEYPVDCTLLSDTKQCIRLINYKEDNRYTLSILTLNIRSIHCNLDLFLTFMTTLNFPVDIFVLTECWTCEDNPPPIINGYNIHWTKNSINQNDGLAVYVRHELGASSYEPSFLEGNCLILNVNPEFTIVCSYRPPCFKNTTTYLNSLDNVLSNIKNSEYYIHRGY